MAHHPDGAEFGRRARFGPWWGSFPWASRSFHPHRKSKARGVKRVGRSNCIAQMRGSAGRMLSAIGGTSLPPRKRRTRFGSKRARTFGADMDREPEYPLPFLMSLAEVAQHSRLAPGTVRAAVRSGELRATKLRGQWRVRRDWFADRVSAGVLDVPHARVRDVERAWPLSQPAPADSSGLRAARMAAS